MQRTLPLFPWAVRYSVANEGFIVYIPAAAVVGHSLDLTALTQAKKPAVDGQEASENIPLMDWYVVPGQSNEAVFAIFSVPEEEDSSTGEVIVNLSRVAQSAEGLLSVQLAEATYDATAKIAAVTQYVTGAITLTSAFESLLNREAEETAEAIPPVAWIVRRKRVANPDATDGGDALISSGWQVYSPIWTWGKGLELLVTGMQEGWNDIPAEVASGTLYAVVELRGTKDGYGNIAWNPKEMTLKNTLEGLVNSVPTGEGSSAEPGVRWLAVRIGSFPEVDTSLSPEDDRRPFNQLHIGAIVENLYSGSSYGSYDIVSGLRYDASSHKLVCLVRTWNGQTLGVPHDGPGLVLSAYSVTKSTLLWSGNVLTRMDNTVSLRLFEAPTESGGAAEAIFATAPHEADESTPYEGDLSGLATSDATI